MTRLQIDSISKMQEIIALAKSGKKTPRTYIHKEFINAIKGKLPDNFQYEKCSDKAKERWLSMVEKAKQ